MTRAYNESYLSDAKDRLSQFFDYLINDCGMKADWVASIFLSSGYAEQFERGNPAILAGMSGIELARAVVEAIYKKKKLPEPRYSEGLSTEYWAGWALAEYQWHSGKRFKDIFEHVKLSEIIPMYSVYHEMDISKFIETMDEKCATALPECRLKKMRESRGLSQSELAKISGVSLRSIQMYEQRVNDIDKAQAQTIYKLSRVIGCSMEDLLEKPME
jgi:DNA-binding XRE family transcriptional regulator